MADKKRPGAGETTKKKAGGGPRRSARKTAPKNENNNRSKALVPPDSRRAGLPKTAADWEKLLSNEAGESRGVEAPSRAPFISTRGHRFTIGELVLPDPMEVVIVAFNFVNEYYVHDFDPNERTPPACAALSETETGMVPSEHAPMRQADACENCPQNAFGSGTIGNAKACSNRRRLALMMSADLTSQDDPPLAVLPLPPNSIGPWKDLHAQCVEIYKRPTHAVITSWSFDRKRQFPVPIPTLVDIVKNSDHLAKIHVARERAKELIATPYDFSGFEAPTGKSRRGGGKKKAAGKKTAGKKASSKKGPRPAAGSGVKYA